MPLSKLIHTFCTQTYYHRVHILIIILMTGTSANSVDSDEMLYKVAFEEGPFKVAKIKTIFMYKRNTFYMKLGSL